MSDQSDGHNDPQGEVERLRLCTNLAERASLLRAPDASALDNETAVLLLEAEACITLLADDLVSARVDPKHQALAEFDEIADGAWGDGPRTRGLAKRKADALRPSAGAGEIEALVAAAQDAANLFREYYHHHMAKSPPDAEKAQRNGDMCVRLETALTAPAPGVQTEALDPANAVSSIDYHQRLGRKPVVMSALRRFLEQWKDAGSQTTIGIRPMEHGVLTLSDLHWIADNEAALPAPSARNAIYEGTGWLIERRPDDGPPTWMCLTESLMVPTWVADASKALRFARREDAEAYFAFEVDEAPGIFITEHKWISK